MPDLTQQPFYQCRTAEQWHTTVTGSAGNTYTIRWGQAAGFPGGPGHKNPHVSYDYYCDCKAYKFGKKLYCKHIEQVKASGEHCNWMEQLDAIPTKSFSILPEYDPHDGEVRCPKCNGPTDVRLWGV